MERVHHLHEGRHAFVEPGITPILAGDRIAKPLVSGLVRNDPSGGIHTFAGV